MMKKSTIETKEESPYTLNLSIEDNAYVPPDEPPETPPGGEGTPPAEVKWLPTPVRDDRWRNKLLYITGALGLEMGYFRGSDKALDQAWGSQTTPALRVGAEYHFLNFMSAELDLKAAFLNIGGGWIFEPSFMAAIKGVWKPLVNLILEPYGGMEFSLPIEAGQEGRLAVLGGAQIGPEGRCPWSDNHRFIGLLQLNGKCIPHQEHGGAGGRGMMKFTFLVGYKFGFWDRKKPGPKQNVTPDGTAGYGHE